MIAIILFEILFVCGNFTKLCNYLKLKCHTFTRWLHNVLPHSSTWHVTRSCGWLPLWSRPMRGPRLRSRMASNIVYHSARWQARPGQSLTVQKPAWTPHRLQRSPHLVIRYSRLCYSTCNMGPLTMANRQEARQLALQAAQFAELELLQEPGGIESTALRNTLA